MKLMIVTLASFVTLTPFCEASGLPRFLETKMKQSALQATQKAAAGTLAFRGDNCADFSGSWVGTCTAGGKEENLSLTVVQDACKSIKVNEDTMRIGEHGLVGDSPAEDTFVAASWSTGLSADGQNLLLNVMFSADLFQQGLPIGGRVFSTAHRDAENLLVDGSVNVWNGNQPVAQEQIACRFKKQ